MDRSEYILGLFQKYISPEMSILEIGHGDGCRVKFLKEHGYTNIEGIDKKDGTAIEDVPFKEYDVIYTMSTLFLIPPENNWVFEKIAKMAKKYIITVEGETSHTRAKDSLYGRNYTMVFEPFGFKEVEKNYNVFNEHGVSRVLCKNC